MDELVKHMVDRFLGWQLPENFNPDNGISFKPTFNDHLPVPMKCNPTGTNLFDAQQAEAMVRYMLEGRHFPPSVPIPKKYDLKWAASILRNDAQQRLDALMRSEHEGVLPDPKNVHLSNTANAFNRVADYLEALIAEATVNPSPASAADTP